MRYSPIIAVIILMPGLFDDELKAQDVRKLDSLKSKLEIATPKEKVKILLTMCVQYVDVNDQQALTYAEGAYDAAKKAGDTSDIVKSGRIEGQLLARNECINESIALMSYILPIAERNNFFEEQKRILNSLGSSYIMNADYAEALKYNSEALLLREADGDKAKISIALNNMGVLYYKMQNFGQALNYYNKSYMLKSEVHDNHDLEMLLINIALCYVHLRDYTAAFEYIHKAEKGCGSHCNDQMKISEKYASALAFLLKKDFRNAEMYFFKSYDLSQKLNDKRHQLENLTELITIMLEEDRLSEARKFLLKAEKLSLTTSYDDILMRIYQRWSILYIKTKNFELAASYQKKYIDLNQSVLTGKINDMVKVQSEFNEYENRKIIQTQREVLSLHEQVIRNHKVINLLMGFTALVLMMMIGYVLNRYKLKLKHNRMLDLKVRERTKLLDESLITIKKSHEIENQVVIKVRSSLKEQLSTMKGLINILLNENSDQETNRKGILLISETEEKISSIVKRLPSQMNESSCD